MADADADAFEASASVGSSSPSPAAIAVDATLRTRSYPVEETGENRSKENSSKEENETNETNIQGPSRAVPVSAAAIVEEATSDLLPRHAALLVVELESVQQQVSLALDMNRSLSVGVRSLAGAVEQRRPLEEVRAIAQAMMIMMPPTTAATWESEPPQSSSVDALPTTGDISFSDLLPRDFPVQWANVQQLLAQTLEANRDICRGVRSVVDAIGPPPRPSLEQAPPIASIVVRRTDETTAVDADAGAGAVAVAVAHAEAETATSAHAEAEVGSSSSSSSGGGGGGSSTSLSLAEAIEQGQPLDVIRAIVQARPHEMESGCYPLHLGVRLRAPPDVIGYLAGAVPEAHRRLQYTNGWPLLHHAARTSPLQVVRLVLRLDPGALTTQTAKGDDLPLHLVGANPDAVRVVRFLAHKRPAALREANRDGWLPLHAAAAAAAPASRWPKRSSKGSPST
jgi:hypothetical protein